MKFEEKMKALEKIVSELEQDEINLDESINKYTEAMKLIKECDVELKDAEEKISKIVSKDGELKEFELTE
ncbi:MAG: exodeoxyribonuclease VII small subunit [Bacilli bacterium]|jgi:exodeoxyribonuclease VII small subunit|nr:exodeoxyribonuclease VII small subunit [Bacilli bacterium]